MRTRMSTGMCAPVGAAVVGTAVISRIVCLPPGTSKQRWDNDSNPGTSKTNDQKGCLLTSIKDTVISANT